MFSKTATLSAPSRSKSVRLLLTGSTGFLGRAVRKAAETAEAITFCATRASRGGSPGEIALGPGPWRRAEFKTAIAATAPDVIIHAAGAISSPDSATCFEANTILAAELLDAIAGISAPPRILLIGSAAELGFVPADAQPVAEDFPCAPRTTYGIAKHAQTLLGVNAAAQGLPVLVVRLFNLVGAGMAGGLALSSFARRVSNPAVSAIRVGNLAVARDFIDVSEASRILLALAALPRFPWPLVNLCSGHAWNLGELLHQMILVSGRSLSVEPDPALYRPGEQPTLRGDTSRLAGIGLPPKMPDFTELIPALLQG